MGLTFFLCWSVDNYPLYEVDPYKLYYNELLHYLGINQTLSAR